MAHVSRNVAALVPILFIPILFMRHFHVSLLRKLHLFPAMVTVKSIVGKVFSLTRLTRDANW